MNDDCTSPSPASSDAPKLSTGIFFRPPCPFYGFSQSGHTEADRSMIDSQSSNQCALVVMSLHPCEMEIDGEAPNWKECPLKKAYEEEVMEQMRGCRVFPHEHRPPGAATSWRGIPFEEWMQRILK